MKFATTLSLLASVYLAVAAPSSSYNATRRASTRNSGATRTLDGADGDGYGPPEPTMTPDDCSEAPNASDAPPANDESNESVGAAYCASPIL